MTGEGKVTEAKPGDGDLQGVIETLRRLIRQAVPDAKESANGVGAAWIRKDQLCSVATAKDAVVLAFDRGSELVDRHGLLEGEGPGARHLTIHSAVELDEPALTDLVRQAAALAES
jgi:hypothetical protein